MSSGRMQDLVNSRINEGAIYKYIDIQAGGVGGYRSKMQDIIVLRRCEQMIGGGWGRVVAMRLQGLSPLDTHSKRSKKNSPQWRVRQPGEDEKSVGR